MTAEKKPARQITDEEAMERIRRILSGWEWDADVMQLVAEVVRLTGRAVSEPPQDEEDEAEE